MWRARGKNKAEEDVNLVRTLYVLDLVVFVQLFNGFCQLGHDFEYITDQAVSSMLEDWRIGIFVDRHNYF